MAAPILWAPGKIVFLLQENLHAHKIPLFLGGGEGGSGDFIFYGREDFSDASLGDMNSENRRRCVQGFVAGKETQPLLHAWATQKELRLTRVHEKSGRAWRSSAEWAKRHEVPRLHLPRMWKRHIWVLWKTAAGALLAVGDENWTQTFFSQTFRAPPGYPGKIPGCPGTKRFGFPGFRRTYRTFWPPPLHVEDPHPTRKYPDQKVWVWVPFSSLRQQPLPFGRC